MNKNHLYRCFVLWRIIPFLFLFCSLNIFSQSSSDTIPKCAVKSLPELLKKKDSILTLKPIKDSFFLVIPVIGSSPATGFLYGAVAQYTFKGKQNEDISRKNAAGKSPLTAPGQQCNAAERLQINYVC